MTKPISRRLFLGGLIVAPLMAPSIVRSTSIMKIKADQGLNFPFGKPGQVLTSDGQTLYWASVDSGWGNSVSIVSEPVYPGARLNLEGHISGRISSDHPNLSQRPKPGREEPFALFKRHQMESIQKLLNTPSPFPFL